MPRRVFLALRFPGAILFSLLLLFGLGFGGWYLLGNLPGTLQLQEQMRKNIDNLSGYYASYKTSLFGAMEGLEYSVQIWKSAPNLYRLEMSGLPDNQLLVMINDGSRAFLYNQELGDFFPVHDIEGPEAPYLSLEDYWQEIAGAVHFDLMSEKTGLRHNYYQVEVFPTEPHRHRTREIIWLEAGSLLPVRIEVYDSYGTLTQLTTFEILQLNPVLEAALFMVEP